jgi:hypothetical protein
VTICWLWGDTQPSSLTDSNLFSHTCGHGQHRQPPLNSAGTGAAPSVGPCGFIRTASDVRMRASHHASPVPPSYRRNQALTAGSETRRRRVDRGASAKGIIPAPARAGPTSVAAPSRERGFGVLACRGARRLMGGCIVNKHIFIGKNLPEWPTSVEFLPHATSPVFHIATKDKTTNHENERA